MVRGGEEYDAGAMTVGQIVRRLDLDERDRICYLFDYCDEWRFYAILKEINKKRSRSSELESSTTRANQWSRTHYPTKSGNHSSWAPTISLFSR